MIFVYYDDSFFDIIQFLPELSGNFLFHHEIWRLICGTMSGLHKPRVSRSNREDWKV